MELSHDEIHILGILNKPLAEVRSARNRLIVNGKSKDPLYLRALIHLETLELAERSNGERRRGISWVAWDITEKGIEALEKAPRHVRLMLAWAADELRKGGYTEQGSAFERTTATGRSTCRACGKKIAKGEECLAGFYDFVGCGSRTATKCCIHLESCAPRET